MKRKGLTDGINSIYTGMNFAIQYIRYSSSFKESPKRKITLDIHSIEKGLSTRKEEFCKGFGTDKIQELKEYLDVIDDPYFKKWIEDTLKAYNDKHSEKMNKDKMLMAGTTEITPVNYSQINLEMFLNSRHSVRYFRNEYVQNEVIDEAVKIARHAPSACNRQAVKLYVIRDKNKIQKLADLQRGHRGSENAPCWIVITGDLSMYSGSELKMALVDCGIFTMTMILALNFTGLECCCLHGCMRQKKEKAVKKLCDIPNNEIISNFIMTGYGEYGSLSPRSTRKPYEMLVRYVD